MKLSFKIFLLFSLSARASFAHLDDNEFGILNRLRGSRAQTDDSPDSTTLTLQGPFQLTRAIEDARRYMFNASWLKENPAEQIAADRQLKNQLAASLEQGFALHDPLHPELRYFDPQNQFGLFNPDNRYYIGTIDHLGEYIIRGKLGNVSDVNFEVGGGNPGFDATQVNIDAIDLLTLPDIVRDENGEFEIVISAENTNGAANWLRNSKPCESDSCDGPIVGATGILIRETFMNWGEETGCTWYIERTDTRGLPSPTVDQDTISAQYDRASRYMLNGTIGWVNLVENILDQLPFGGDIPFLAPPTLGDNGFVGQFNAIGVMPLSGQEAYVVKLKKNAEARYQGFQIGDLWFNSHDYCRRQISLNMDQAQVSSDDNYYFVVSPEDPETANWLDPSGITKLVAFLRWQGMNTTDFPEDEIPELTATTIDNVRSYLPDDEPVFSETDRKEQLAARHQACLNKPRGF